MESEGNWKEDHGQVRWGFEATIGTGKCTFQGLMLRLPSRKIKIYTTF